MALKKDGEINKKNYLLLQMILQKKIILIFCFEIYTYRYIWLKHTVLFIYAVLSRKFQIDSFE